MKFNPDLKKKCIHRHGGLEILYKDFSSKDCFIRLSHLKRLKLSDNQNFKTIKSEAFKNQINLERLNLRNNQIAKISKNALKVVIRVY
jgi:Leucine-rich repeat (LRR) protein